MWFALGCLVALAGVIVYGVRGSESRAVRVVAVVVASVLVLPLAVVVGLVVHLTTPMSGDRVASERAEATATEMADELVVPHHNSNGALDGEQLALYAVQHAVDIEYGLGVWEARDREITVLGWSGATADRDGATVDLRIDVHVPSEPGGLLGRDRSEGDAVRCWRLTVEYYEYDESAGLDEIGCPTTPVDHAPVPAGVPSLGPDAGTKVLRALRAAPELPGDTSGVERDLYVEAVEEALWEQFSPEDLSGYGATTYAQLEDDALVVAVGLAPRRECVVGVREQGRAPFLFSDVPTDQLAAGGIGCRPSLYSRFGSPPSPSSGASGPAPGPTTTDEPTASPEPSRPWLLDEATTPVNEKLLFATLAELPVDAGEGVVREAVSEAFPDYTVDAGREGDEVVATVVGPTHRDCMVAVRVGDDEPFRYSDFPRIFLEPGEIGCRPSLYWTEATAH